MVQAICWTLIHSLWEGGLCAIIAGLVLLGTRRSASATRYNLLCGLFFLFLALSGCTFYFEWAAAPDALRPESVNASWLAERATAGQAISACMAWMGEYITDHDLFIVSAWMLICLYKCLRMTSGILHLRRLRRNSSQTDQWWNWRLQLYCRELGIRRAVALRESLLVHGPVVIGALKPMILMPMGLLTGLPEKEVEAVLLHELAHIRRLDYSMNFLQRFTETGFFFNPGILWISALLRDEREHCCDDLAISTTRDKVQFVRALVSFREVSMPPSGRAGNGRKLAMAFPSKKGHFLQRVERILYNKNKTLRPGEKLFLLVSCLALCCLVAMPGVRHDRNNGHAYLAIQGGSESPIRPAKAVERNLQEPDARSHDDGAQDFQGIKPASPKLRDLVKEKLLREERLAEKNVVRARRGSLERQAAEFQAQLQELQNNDVIRNKQEIDDVQREKEAIERNKREFDDEQREKAVLERQQAEIDRQQASKDHMQIEQDRMQAREDWQAAEKARKQAEADRKLAEIARLQAELDRQLAKALRTQTDKDRKQAELDRQQIIHTNKD